MRARFTTMTKGAVAAGCLLLLTVGFAVNVARTPGLQEGDDDAVVKGVDLFAARPGLGNPGGGNPGGENLGGGNGGGGPSGGGSSGPGFFYISGNVSHLAPGVGRSLELTLDNPNNFDIYVRELSAKVKSIDPAHSGCPISALSIAGFTGDLFVAKKGSTSQPLTATLSPSASDACQGASFRLSYDGTAVKR